MTNNRGDKTSSNSNQITTIIKNLRTTPKKRAKITAKKYKERQTELYYPCVKCLFQQTLQSNCVVHQGQSLHQEQAGNKHEHE